jgi:hypothetical protein
MAESDCKRRLDLLAVDTHFAQLRGDIDATHKIVIAASSYLEMIDFMQKGGALRADVDYLSVLRTILCEAKGMVTAAEVEWDEVEQAMGPLGYDQAKRAGVMEVANG